MKRTGKAGCILMLIFIALIALELGVIRETAFAGGGINYKVTMQNPTKHDCKVSVWVDKVTHFESMGEKMIPGESTASWETGAWCIVGVTGSIYSELDKKWFTMQQTTCEGINVPTFSVTVPHCWDVHLEVHRKNGIGHPNLRDEDYGFRKR